MELNVDRNELQQALNIVSKGITSRSTLPILAGILISAQDDNIKLQSTDLETAVSHQVSADVISAGKIVVPGKLFVDIIKNLPNAAVHIELSGNQAIITCMNSSFNVSTLFADDFPEFPYVKTDQLISIPSSDLARAVTRVAFAASHDEARPILTGILFDVRDKFIRLVTTDSYRLAYADIATTIPQESPFKAVIPCSIFSEVSKLCVSQPAVSIGFSENQVIFSFGDTVFITRRVEGSYPDYENLFSQSFDTEAVIDSKELKSALKRVCVITDDKPHVSLNFDVVSQKLTLLVHSQDVGDAKETIDAQIESEENLELSFNGQHLLDSLNVINDKLSIKLQKNKRPTMLQEVEDNTCVYLVVPLRL